MVNELNIGAAAAAIYSLSGTVGSFLVYILAGVVPCLLWLFFYVEQDRHQEPKKEILAVFLIGALMTVPAVAMEIFLINAIGMLNLPATIAIIATNILAIAFIEEFSKYFAVWIKEQAVNQNKQLDEPVDFVIYMVVSALGFAAVENLLFLLPTVQEQIVGNTFLLHADGAFQLMSLSVFRSLSAILLHTLCSGVLGYYMAMTFCHREKKMRLLATGFVTVSCLHGLYNFSIIKSESDFAYLFIPLAIIFTLAVTLFVQFTQLGRTKSVCDMRLSPKQKFRTKN
ncbi:MAG: PrsW family intramembrane metalloprotease [Candidatus Pacebacteria bacterium]|jgi:RsiW-degrading membrane proteinase PrsW (M82 family)|nr:PrsW family intramembrane metalloprotease [Candidatus Paceibacterota bacterium]